MISPTQHSELMKVLIKQLEDMGVYKSCINCYAFNESKETCSVAGNIRPPARVIATGCESWDEDIPF